MPDQSRGMKGDLPIAVEDSPTKVDVVTRDHVDRVKAAELLQRRAPERHIASGYVLRQIVRQQNVNGPPGRGCDLLGAHGVGRRTFIGTPDPNDIVFLESHGEVVGPLWR